MNTYKEQLLFNIRREIALLKQLAAAVEEKDMDFRPGEKVRSTRELMQYLSGIGATMMRWMLKNDITQEDWAQIRAYRQTVNRENFASRLDDQMRDIENYFAGISEDELLHMIVELPNKEKLPLGAAIINAPIKWLTAYRMQLFVNLKLNGNHGIGTREAWSVMS